MKAWLLDGGKSSAQTDDHVEYDLLGFVFLRSAC
jgi:hypothetical protein